jgi:outer membrane receptor protein involved in Fe transport
VYGYAYHTFPGNFTVTAGLTYDHISYPAAFTEAPLVEGRQSRDQLGPKAGFSWSPKPGFTWRAAYSQVQAGFAIDEPVRLEPNQVAGFIQAFRSLIPENLTGSLPAAHIETAGTAWEFKAGVDTYLGAGVSWGRSDVDRERAVFDTPFFPFPPSSVEASTYRELYDYEETAFTARIDRLLGEHWGTGGSIAWTESSLNRETPDLPATFVTAPVFEGVEAELLHASWNVRFQSPNGWYARAEYHHWWQENSNYTPALEDDSFPVVNLFLGYRLKRARGEFTISLLNITDEDYRINPLSNFNELPREFTVAGSARFSF